MVPQKKKVLAAKKREAVSPLANINLSKKKCAHIVIGGFLFFLSLVFCYYLSLLVSR
jgi:hypothetical protein